MIPVVVLMLFMGLYPRPLLSRMEPSVNAMLSHVHAAQARIDAAHSRRHLAAVSDPSHLINHQPEIAAATR